MNDDITFDNAPVVPNNWTDEDEAEWQRMRDELDDAYEESVRASYAARGYHNIY